MAFHTLSLVRQWSDWSERGLVIIDRPIYELIGHASGDMNAVVSGYIIVG